MDKSQFFLLIIKISFGCWRENKKICQHKILYLSKISISSEADNSTSVYNVENPKKILLLH